LGNLTSSCSGLVGIGDNVVDHYVDQDVYYPGGNALNVAVLARRFGLVDTAYIGLIGDDEYGAHVRASLRAEGLSDAHVRQATGETGYSSCHIVDGDRVFLGSNAGGIRRKLVLRMDVDDLDLIGRLGHVHTSCYSYLEPELQRIRAAVREISFDFSIRRDRDYMAVVCPMITLAFLSGSDLSDDERDSLIRDLHAFGAQQVCITQGERGAVFSDGSRVLKQGIVKADIVDTMGAGDAFIAGLLAARINGAEIEAALSHAADSAARACGWRGAFGHPHPSSG
jgi:fructoselysine 6-kinase